MDDEKPPFSPPPYTSAQYTPLDGPIDTSDLAIRAPDEENQLEDQLNAARNTVEASPLNSIIQVIV